MPRMPLWLLGLFVVFFFVSCGKKDQPFRKLTVPVTGQIFVDGQLPSPPLTVFCVSTGEVDEDHPTMSAATTDEQGRFSMSTYVTGDGVPVGEYTLTFSWSSRNEVVSQYPGSVKSRKRPKSLKKLAVKFKVSEGQPVDLGHIELTTGDG